MRRFHIAETRKFVPGLAFFLFSLPAALFFIEQQSTFNVNLVDQLILIVFLFFLANYIGQCCNDFNRHLLSHHHRFWQRLFLRVFGFRYRKLRRQFRLTWLVAEELTLISVALAASYAVLFLLFGKHSLLLIMMGMIVVTAIVANLLAWFAPTEQAKTSRKTPSIH